jgi:cell division protein FtsN
MRQQQRGGTFLGIIIGVVIGLGAALAVAIYVTKVPVPFLNKSQPRKADQDAAEALKNKDWDPNAPLYGKNPARTAAPEANPVQPAPAAVPEASAARPARGSASAPATAASASRSEGKSATSSDPLGDLARSRSAGATADPFSYFVQAGAFRTPEDAEGQRAKLGLMGVEAKVTEREQSGRTVYRVRVGPFDSKDAADRVKERIDGGGMESALVRVQR